MDLKCVVQRYAWGKQGASSLVARLTASNDIDEPHAELWMGTHISGPSIVKATAEPLADHLARSGVTMPYLFKVLSIAQPLSVQVHPDKPTAEKLHMASPGVYKDANHKPEMAIAVTDFEALCGFKPASEIKEAFKTIPGLRLVVNNDDIVDKFLNSTENTPSCLKEVFAGLMRQTKDKLTQVISQMRLDLAKSESLTDQLFMRLANLYPSDVGVFIVYFVNYFKLKPGEAIFLGANIIHAYLSGDCIECMAKSDNVVRAGLTPKLIDIDTLVSILDYSSCLECPDVYRIQPTEESANVQLYAPPVDDFMVVSVNLTNAQSLAKLPPRSGPSILVCLTGGAQFKQKSMSLSTGQVVYIDPGQEVTLGDADDSFVGFVAFC